MAKQTVAKNSEPRKIEDFKDVDEDFKKKTNGTETDYVLPDHEKTQKRSQQLQGLEDEQAQSRKHTSKYAKRTEQARIEIEQLRASMEEQKRSMREKWIWKSEHWERLKVNEAAMHVSVGDQQGSSLQSSNVNATRYLTGSINQLQRRHLVIRHHGVVNGASENAQNSEGKLEVTQWKKEMEETAGMKMNTKESSKNRKGERHPKQ